MPDENTEPGDGSKCFNEQWLPDKKSRVQTLNAFGSNPQPLLEKVEYKVDTVYYVLRSIIGVLISVNNQLD